MGQPASAIQRYIGLERLGEHGGGRNLAVDIAQDQPHGGTAILDDLKIRLA